MITMRYIRMADYRTCVGDFGNIKNFCIAVREKLDKGMPIKVVLEPGDMTRYEFILIPNIEREDLLVCRLGQYNFAILLDNDCPYSMEEIMSLSGESKSPWTCAVVAQLINDIYNRAHLAYNWEQAQPV